MSEDQSRKWTLEDRSPDDLKGTFNATKFEQVLDSPSKLAALQGRVVKTALETSPDLQSIDRLIGILGGGEA